MRRAAKVDANQEQIVSALRAAGATVQSLAPIGKGCPDLLAAKDGQMWLFEVKHGKGEPNDLQVKWHAAWDAPVYVVYGPEEALSVIGVLGSPDSRVERGMTVQVRKPEFHVERTAMTREEWVRRYADRVKEQAGWPEDAAMECAETGARSHEHFERAAGNAILWENPEDAADEEMSYWEDDGE